MDRPITSSLAAALAQRGVERSLPQVRADIARLNEQMTTGIRVGQASDDPTAFVTIRTLRAREDKLARYDRTIGAATLWTDQTQAALDEVAGLFTEVHATGLRAASGTPDYTALADQIAGFRAEVIARLNATSGGEYLFSGNRTDTAPLLDDGTVAGTGFDGARRREVGPGITLKINVPGSDALYVDGEPATDRLLALEDAVRSGDNAAIQAALAGTKAGSDHYIELGARAGLVANRLGLSRSSIEAEELVVSKRRSGLEEADLADVLGQLQRRQVALEATLKATAATLQTSLLEYLR